MYEEFYDDWQTWQHEFAQPLTLRTAEAPFLASSSQLTHLSLGHDFGSMDAACYSLMFTPRSVPNTLRCTSPVETPKIIAHDSSCSSFVIECQVYVRALAPVGTDNVVCENKQDAACGFGIGTKVQLALPHCCIMAAHTSKVYCVCP